MKRHNVAFLFISCCIAALFLPSSDKVSAEHHGRYYYEERGEVVWEVSTDQKVIALTFDDGPNPEYTPQVLDVLKQHQAKATFFVIGSRIEQYPELAQREVREGHELANHSYHHPGMTRISAEKLREEIEQAQNVIVSATGQTPKAFRPPGGVYNDKVVNTAKQAGYMVVMWTWNQDTRDWRRPGVRKIVDQVLSNAHNGSIVLFHDHGGDRSQTVNALTEILPELKKR
ncbi:MAG: polysaccharide deacetylase family protein [Tumebacillaceae bacterium]